MDSLVLFDVDDVLISPTDEFNFNSEIRKNIKKTMQQRKDKNEIKLIFSNFFRKRKVKLVNTNIISLLSRIKDQNISASALSAYWTGAFGSIEAMELKRLEEFNQVGISFEDISPFKQDMKFLSYKTNNGTPMIISGVILTALANKGEILDIALQQTESNFKQIIFIDDQIKYLKEVKNFCDKKQIKFIGIHYTESSKSPIPVFDQQKEKYRFDILEKDLVWLSDEELNARWQMRKQ